MGFTHITDLFKYFNKNNKKLRFYFFVSILTCEKITFFYKFRTVFNIFITKQYRIATNRTNYESPFKMQFSHKKIGPKFDGFFDFYCIFKKVVKCPKYEKSDNFMYNSAKI